MSTNTIPKEELHIFLRRHLTFYILIFSFLLCAGQPRSDSAPAICSIYDFSQLRVVIVLNLTLIFITIVAALQSVQSAAVYLRHALFSNPFAADRLDADAGGEGDW